MTAGANSSSRCHQEFPNDFSRSSWPSPSPRQPPAARGSWGTRPTGFLLADQYAIYRRDKAIASQDRQLHDLVAVDTEGESVGVLVLTLVPHVEQVAVHDRVIFGRSEDGFFIVDARLSEQRPRTFDARESWETALHGMGVPNPDVLKSPDSLAMAMPEHVLRPWKYRVMGNTLGLSDDVWSLVVQMLGLAVAFALGVLWTPRRSPMLAAAVFGLVVNVVAQVVIAGGGPSAFVGFVGLPLLCMLAAALGRGVRGVISLGLPTR